MEQAPAFELSESTRRAVETTLQLLDEALCRIEEWARGRQHRSVLYAETNRLSPAQRRGMLREVAAMRGELRAARDALALAPRRLNAARDIWALCSGLRVDLMEMESTRLRGYGALPEPAAACIDGTSGRLGAGLDRIVGILAAGPSAEEQP
jgi:hypothetical protein